jgi:hypothetical protein
MLHLTKTAQDRESNAEPAPATIVPFDRYGAGNLTGHPVGLVIVVGLVLMGFFGLPEYRVFFVAAIALGAVWGGILWRLHR